MIATVYNWVYLHLITLVVADISLDSNKYDVKPFSCM